MEGGMEERRGVETCIEGGIGVIVRTITAVPPYMQISCSHAPPYFNAPLAYR